MNNNRTLKSAQLLKALRKDQQLLYTDLVGNISEIGARNTIQSKLDSISTLSVSDLSANQQRKILSRKIGAAKANGVDCSELIQQVSEISDQINCLKNQIKKHVLEIESVINDSSSQQITFSAPAPMHLRHLPASDPQDDNFTISHSDYIDQNNWQTFIEQSAHATIYHDARWQQIIHTNFNHQLLYISCIDQHKKLIGVLPVVHLKSKLFGSFTTSMPYFNYGGPLAHTTTIEDALLSYAATLSENRQCSHMEVRETRERAGWKSVTRKVSMILPLPHNDKLLDSALGTKIRAQVKKSKYNQLDVVFGGPELINDFYLVFSRNMRDLGTPVYSRKFFNDIINVFNENAFICIVYRKSKPLAAGFLLGYRDKLEIPWASSIKSQNHLGANMVMYRSILKEAIARDYRFFDFGRSTRGANTYKFKKQWGAVEHPLHWHYWTKDDSDLPAINPDNPKYKLVIGTWKRLPVFITKLIGPAIARNLP